MGTGAKNHPLPSTTGILGNNHPGPVIQLRDNGRAADPFSWDSFLATAWLWTELGGGLLLSGGVPLLPPNAAPRPVGGTNQPVSSTRAARPTQKIAAAGATGLCAVCNGPRTAQVSRI